MAVRRIPSAGRAAAFVAGLISVAACGGADGSRVATTNTTVAASTTSTTTTSTTTTSTSSPAAPTSSPVASATSTLPDAPPVVPAEQRAALLCARTGIEVAGRVETPDLDEASGLAASRAHPGVLWSHNDGAEQPGVFALGSDGSDLGFHDLPADVAAVVTDVEDIAIAAGPAGDVLYLADIGDNRERRESISLFRFPEPDPTAPGTLAGVERFEFTYPDRAHNAEALLIDEANDRAVIVTKQQAPDDDGRPDPLGATGRSTVFEGSLDRPDGGPIELVAVGFVDAVALEQRTVNPFPHPATLVGVGGVVTGGDVSVDGALVALRTYEAVWVWPRRPGESVAQVVTDVDAACQVAAFPELQGEAVAFVGDAGGLGLVTLGEGVGQPLHRLGR
ncbi:MAG TPA: hypothetical protein VK853_09910 [Ilumatobacteraceae bacterium]|nr:hypothetical protein [Ilumatobacteraceae bacterium]